MTVEFWFKLSNSRSYKSLSHIFSITDPVTSRTFMEIFIAKNKLVCAPFGAQDRKRPYLMFDNFNLINEDQTGWWHISCSYSYKKEIEATLFNTNTSTTKRKAYSKKNHQYLPMRRPFIAYFGKPRNIGKASIDGVYLKEVRVWSAHIKPEQVAKYRS